ncbi:hypothetical protein [Pedobacter nutrimenti]|jgi:hypothetical protein|uniref:Uncharacterized protein n=1 Tax=Pedobacter nutrimenti TaxID=1241337 RepID=A0A318U9Y6_9SPHI|nr:hypothetical protein [Pedobacter nutrimenti]PYF72405.1 hypothetical protein B0O44_10654 [Pedobacter nutrimenti]
MLKLLTKTLSREFYIQHAGLFLFLFYLLFGTVEASQLLNYHKALLLAIASSPLLLTGCFLLWILYALKCQLFIGNKKNLPAYAFMQLLPAAAKKRQLLVWLQLYALLLLPVLIYAVLLLGLAWCYGYYYTVLSVALFMPVLLMCLSWFSRRKSIYSFLDRQPLFRIPLPVFRKPFILWPVVYVFQKQPLMLLVCKVLSFVLFKAMLWMFADVGNDIRVVLFGLLAAILSHNVLISVLVSQDAATLSFNRSLPVSAIRTLGRQLSVLVLLFLPELLFFSLKVQFNLWAIFQGLLFGLSGLFFFRMLFFALQHPEDGLKFLLFFFILSSLAILSGLILPYSLILASASVFYFFYSFYQKDLRESTAPD